MNYTSLEKVGVEKQEVMKRFADDEEFYERILRRFLQDRCSERMAEACEEGDYERAFKEAHTLKGVALNLGLAHLQQAVSVVTETLRNGSFEDKAFVRNQIEKVRIEEQRAKEAIEAL